MGSLIMTRPEDPWERQPDESDRAWALFQRYRDLGAARRSLPRLASEVIGETPDKPRKPESVQRELERWSSRHRWRSRVTAWDEELDRRQREAEADEIVAMHRRHARLVREQLEVVAEPGVELARRINEGRSRLSEASDRELFGMTLAAARVVAGLMQQERLARGFDVEARRNDQRHEEAPSAEITDEHLIAVWAALDEIGVRPHPPNPG
jgi:hypothetical protein